ncbi:MAG: hypothetical protein JSW33_06090 [bacterium]|nr:MAG: hypothetical protein JSW33_06090 [bacterium]
MRNFILLFMWVIFIIGLHCTENPFYKNPEEVKTQRTVTGHVLLNDQSTPDSIFVWLEEFDIGTYSDANGIFSMRLPPPEKQAGGGVDGIFNLFFYVSNFRIDSVRLAVKNGEFVYGSADINSQGVLIQPVVLQKLLEIETVVSPDTFTSCYDKFVIVKLRLKAFFPQVNIAALTDYEQNISGIILKRNRSEEALVTIIRSHMSQLNTQITISGFKEYISYYKYDYCSFPAGDYEIIPFLWVEQPTIPPELFENLGISPHQISLDYLRIPVKRQGGEFRIDPSPGRGGGGSPS